MTLTPLHIVLVGIIGLFGVALYGLLISRNLIKIVLVLQIMVKAAVLALVLAGQVSWRMGIGQSIAATVIVADTIVAVVGLALAVQIRRLVGTVDTRNLNSLKG